MINAVSIKTLVDPSDAFVHDRIEEINTYGPDDIPFHLRHKAESLDMAVRNGVNDIGVTESGITCDDVNRVLNESPSEKLKQIIEEVRGHFQKNNAIQDVIGGARHGFMYELRTSTQSRFLYSGYGSINHRKSRIYLGIAINPIG